MTTPHTLALCVAASTLLVGACGPAPEGEESEIAEILKYKEENRQPPELGESTTGEGNTVSQMTLVGHLGYPVGTPVATFPTTCFATNDVTTTCGSGVSPDISYLWTVPATGSYRFTTSNSNFDTVLEIRKYLPNLPVLGCNDDMSTSLQSKVTLTNLTAGNILVITIEGYEGACGSTYLNITKI